MNPNVLYSEELEIVRDHILAGYMEEMMHRSVREALSSGNVFQKLYAQVSQTVLNHIAADNRQYRAELKKRQIRIMDPIHEELIIYYPIHYRGYNDRFGMTRDVMKYEISVRLAKYVKEVEQLIRHRPKKE